MTYWCADHQQTEDRPHIAADAPTRERDELRAEVERTSESAAAMLKVITEDLPRIQAQRDDARAEVERLTADMGAWVHRQAELQAEVERLRAALDVEREIQRQMLERLGIEWTPGEPFYSLVEDEITRWRTGW